MEPLPVSKVLNRVRLDDVDASRLLDELGITRLRTLRVHARSADTDDDCTTKVTEEGPDDSDSDAPLVNTEVLAGDTSPLKMRR